MFSLASAVYHGRNVTITFPYDPILISRFKIEIPPYARIYVPENKEWIFDSTYAARAVHLLTDRFPDARIENIPDSSPSLDQQQDPEYVTFFVIPEAPPEVVKAAYRALSKLYHPDRGGDTAAMQRLNEAYARIESRLSSGGRV